MLEDGDDRKMSRLGGRQLDGQRQAVQPATDGGNRSRVPGSEGKVGAHRLGPSDEQLHRRSCRHGLDIAGQVVLRNGKRRDGDVPLAGDVESGAARRQHREPGAGFEQAGNEWGRF